MTALVSICTQTGAVRRYITVYGARIKTHDVELDKWDEIRSGVASLDAGPIERFRFAPHLVPEIPPCKPIDGPPRAA